MFIEPDNLIFEPVEDDEPTWLSWVSVLAILTPYLVTGFLLWCAM
jgi:hypothetical protein